MSSRGYQSEQLRESQSDFNGQDDAHLSEGHRGYELLESLAPSGGAGGLALVRVDDQDQETDYETAKRSLEGTATWLARINPDAASSLREGLEETLTVVKLGCPACCVGAWRRPTRSRVR